MKKLSYFIFFIFICVKSYPQFYDAGNEPASVKWEFIEDSSLRLIYPKGFYSEANTLLNRFVHSNNYVNNTMGANPGKIAVILHTNNVISNGFVTMAPRRMELITTPPQNLNTLDWYTELAVHEYRHVAQINRMNRGFTKFMSIIIGQSAFGLPAIEIPLWVIEGDAVVTETALTSKGRGRNADFIMYMKALHTQNNIIKYDKAYFGSYKEHIPDRYELGYQITAFGRLHYDPFIWKKAIEKSGNHSFLPFSFNSGLKKYYNTSVDKIYKQSIDSVKSLWNSEISNVNLTKYSYITDEKSDMYVNQRFPIKIGNNIYFIKSGLKEREHIVKLDSEGKEDIIYYSGATFNNRLSKGKDLIAWTEIQPDIRWNQFNFSVIKVLDTRNNHVRQISFKSRYFSPDLLGDDTKYVAVEIDVNNQNYLIINSLKNKTGLKIPAIKNDILQHPKWVNDSLVTVTGVSENGKTLYLVNTIAQTWDKLYGPVYNNISQPVVWKNHILFVSDLTTVNNIFALDIGKKDIFQLTSSKYGVTDPFISEDTLYYSDYSHTGYRLVKTTINEDKLNVYSSGEFEIAENLSEQEKINLNAATLEKNNYKPIAYRKVNHLINIHSWFPFYVDPDFSNLSINEIKPGVTILSQNLLNTLNASFGLSFQNNNFYFHPGIVYKGLFPVFDLSATVGGNRIVYEFPENITPKDTNNIGSTITLNTYIPFNFTRGGYYRFFEPRIKADIDNALYYSNGVKSGLLRLRYIMSYYRYSRKSLRDIYPKWGQLFSVSYTHTPLGKSQFGTLFNAGTDLYYPGILSNHSVKTSISIQVEEPKFINYLNGERYYPFNQISLPRGYNLIYNGFKAKSLIKGTIDYTFPLFYPDLSVPSVIYIKRLRGALFADFAKAKNIIEFDEVSSEVFRNKWYKSYGIDLVADFHLFRIIFPISAGIRLTYIENYNLKTGIILNFNTAIF